jgi:hypothetical protein
MIRLLRSPSNKQILLTEDKDFGEWVFAHKVSGLTIILLRYSKEESDGMIETLIFSSKMSNSQNIRMNLS